MSKDTYELFDNMIDAFAAEMKQRLRRDSLFSDENLAWTNQSKLRALLIRYVANKPNEHAAIAIMLAMNWSRGWPVMSLPLPSFDAALEETTHAMWAVKPSTLQDNNITRQDFYAMKIRDLIARFGVLIEPVSIDDVVTHYHNWRELFNDRIAEAGYTDNATYWEHERNAFDRLYAAVIKARGEA